MMQHSTKQLILPWEAKQNTDLAMGEKGAFLLFAAN